MKIAIVDGYSTGSALALRLHDQDVKVIHLRSQSANNPYLERSFTPHAYAHDLGYTPDMAEAADQLAALGVERVVAGAESGVMLAESLARTLNLPTNRADTAHARRDKQLMADAAHAAGLSTPRGTAAATPDQAVRWYKDSGFTHVVVKPPASAGTDGVRFCSTLREVEEACRTVLARPNMFGEHNTVALVQERLVGREYYINTVSEDGRHKAAEIWRYTKTVGDGSTPVYDYEEPVHPTSPAGRILRIFTFNVLDALGIRSTAAHTEVMITQRGPVLIETGARLGGATAPGIIERHLGVSQTGLLVRTLTQPGSLDTFDDEKPTPGDHLRNVELINHHRGLAHKGVADRISELPTAEAVFLACNPGDQLEPTRDLLTSPGYVYLAGKPAVVQRDYEQLRHWESEGLYTGPAGAPQHTDVGCTTCPVSA
ncbi:ATP-grasp domain-containing protein [Streptomyces sp. NPDC101455]|uniref:ATP-grasp domain-containing protein n=1 Tax=Streptomyces sp. NPDC101455 TaxID=3366142 RepID=UPI0038050562